MLYEDEDDIFMGSPKSKFFDVMLNANRSLVEGAVENIVDRYSAMELLLEELIEDENEIENRINDILFNKTDEVRNRTNSLYISAMGDVLTQHE